MRLTDADRVRILDLHGKGVARNDIARLVGRSAGSVSKVVADAGLTFARSDEVKAATKARQVDNAEKRARLQERLLDEAALIMDRLHQPHTVFNFGGKDNTYEEHVLDTPDEDTVHTMMRAVGVAVDKSVRLAQVDQGRSGAEAAASMLDRLWQGLTEDGAPDESGD